MFRRIGEIMATELDEKDEAILQSLEIDSRKGTQAIADSLSLPRVTVHDRIRRLKEKGVIKRFTIQRDPRAVGLELRAFIFIRCERGQVDRRDVAEQLIALPFCIRVSIITGDWDLLVEVVASSMDTLGDAILDQLSKVPGVSGTQTMVSFYEFEGSASSFR
ncbi:MAG: Lrp/AsnC family transcriptional regulator [Euryarchaeota archaeon]|nr:Lrp/AsnC family transcriptional regulator [Euryarchaeota archaeon]